MKALILTILIFTTSFTFGQNNLISDNKLLKDIPYSFDQKLLLNFNKIDDLMNAITISDDAIFSQEFDFHDQITLKNKPHSKQLKSSNDQILELIDSCYFYVFDDEIQEMRYNQKCVEIIYNNDFQIIGYTRLIWAEDSWENFLKINNSYDENGKLNQCTISTWNELEWIPSHQYLRTTDNHGNLTNRTVQLWNGIEWNTHLSINYELQYNINNLITDIQTSYCWYYSGQNNFTVDNIIHIDYNSNNDIVYESFQKWNGAYFENYQLNVSYNSIGKWTNILCQKLENNTWNNIAQLNFTYNSDNLRLSESLQIWNGANWINHIAVENILYNNSDLTTQYRLFYYLDNPNYFFQGIIQFTYDDNNNVIKYETKKMTSSGYMDYHEDILHYSIHNYLMDETYSRKDYSCSVIEFAERRKIYRHIPIIENINEHSSLSSLNELNSDEMISIYPNPSSGLFTIISNHAVESTEVCNSIGNTIISTSIIDNKINLSDLSSGIYFLKIKINNTNYFKKLTVE